MKWLVMVFRIRMENYYIFRILLNKTGLFLIEKSEKICVDDFLDFLFFWFNLIFLSLEMDERLEIGKVLASPPVHWYRPCPFISILS